MEAEQEIKRIYERDVFEEFGVLHGLQVMGFAVLWRAVGMPKLDVLTADIRERFGEAGLSKSAAYRYVKDLKAWNEKLGGDPQRVDGLVLQIAQLGNEALAELRPEQNSCSRGRETAI
jgi:hypothetical protein